MEERERNKPAIALGGRPVALVVGDVPEHAVMRHDRAFGAAGRSGRVGLECLGIVREGGRIDGDGGLCHFRLEGQKAFPPLIEQQLLAQRQALRQRERVAMARRVDERERARGLHDDVLERAGSKARVERQRNRPGAHRAEEEFDELRAVSDQHGDALAGRDAKPSQHARDAVHPLVELPIGRAAFPSAEQIDDRNLVPQARHGLVEEKTEVAPTVHVVHGHLGPVGCRQVSFAVTKKSHLFQISNRSPISDWQIGQIRSPYARLIMGVSSFT